VAEAGGVTTLPAQPGPSEHDPWKPPPAAPEASEWAPAPVPALRVQQLLAPESGVPAFPSSPGAEAEVSEAYLAAAPPGGRADSTRVRGVGVTLLVANLGRSVAFYRDVLGFQQVDMGLGSAVLEAGDGRILLRRVVDMAPVDRRLVHLLLEVPDVQAAYDELLLQGVEFVHRPRPVSRYEQLELWSAAFRDPDGHGIALTRWDVLHED
jgi:catechol 2,3-dioxygenase-like lactoylglutathione lyase family enzyme